MSKPGGEISRVLTADAIVLKGARSTWVGPLFFLGYLFVVYFAGDIAITRSFVGLESGFYLVGSLFSGAVYPLLLAVVMFAAFRISREFSLGTVVTVWSRPLSRRGWWLGKLAGVELGLVLFVVLTLVISITLASLRFGFTDLMEKEYLVHSAGALWSKLLQSAGLSAWGLCACAAFMSAIAVFINQSGLTITAGVFLGLLLATASLFPEVQPLLPTYYVTMPWEQFSAMSKGLSLPLTWGELTRTVLIGGAVWSIVAVALGVWGVRRKEVTF